MINVHTGKPTPTVATAFAKLIVDVIQDLNENSTYPSHIAFGHYVGWDLAEAQRLIEAGLRRRGGTRAWMGDRHAEELPHLTPLSGPCLVLVT